MRGCIQWCPSVCSCVLAYVCIACMRCLAGRYLGQTQLVSRGVSRCVVLITMGKQGAHDSVRHKYSKGSGLYRALQDTRRGGGTAAVLAWPGPVGSGPQGPDCSRSNRTPAQSPVAVRRSTATLIALMVPSWAGPDHTVPARVLVGRGRRERRTSVFGLAHHSPTFVSMTLTIHRAHRFHPVSDSLKVTRHLSGFGRQR